MHEVLVKSVVRLTDRPDMTLDVTVDVKQQQQQASIVGQGPIALAVGAGGVVWTIFSLVYHFSSFSLSLGDGPI